MPGTGSIWSVLVYFTILGVGPYIELYIVSKNKNIYIKYKNLHKNSKK